MKNKNFKTFNPSLSRLCSIESKYSKYRITSNSLVFDKWLDFTYPLDNKILLTCHIKQSLLRLWQLFNHLDSNRYIHIQFKIQLPNGLYRSISYVQSVNKNDFNQLLDSFIEFWEIRSDEYHLNIVSQIIFTYKIVNNQINKEIKNNKIRQHKNIVSNNKPSFNFAGFNLPKTMDFTNWGEYTIFSEYRSAIVYKNRSKLEYHISLFEKYQNVEVILNEKIIVKFIDTMRDVNNLSSFTRTIKNQEYIFEDGVLILKKIKRQTNFLKPLKIAPFLNNKFITMDLETRTIDGIMEPYCVSIFDGVKTSSFYLSDFNNSTEMLLSSVKSLLIRKYDDHKVYLHNFSNFDGIFLMKIIAQLSEDIYPIIRDGKIIEVRVKYHKEDNGNYKYTIYFRDSLLLLPSSLSKLAKTFNVEAKGIFPFAFANKVSLLYEGIIPAYSYFEKSISLEQYNEHKKNSTKNWSLKNETIKYCEQDVKTLYQIIDNFNREIFVMFRIDLHKYPTLSSLALAIFRTKFLSKEVQIPIISGQMFNDIKKGYTGGSVDVIKPFGVNIHRYDVNSLYPFVMKTYPMPVGTPYYFEGDITKINFTEKSFGFFNVEVVTPNYLNVPILQTRLNNKTIAPLGSWTGWYSSEEIYNAEKYGYTFKIISGYTFDKAFIFKDYVDFLYKMKVNSSKDSPRYQISKLLMNSLYGRFGMNPQTEEHAIIQSNKFHDYIGCTITNLLDLGNDKELISFFKNNESEQDTNALNISIPIAAMVTSCARIHMSQFKNNPKFQLYYTDTDSIDIDKPLNTKLIGSELGMMKLEHVFNEATFLAPKVYGGITDTYEYVKVKGLKNTVPYKELPNLLYKNNKIEILQYKWYKNMESGNISIKNELYTLMVTDNKRSLIYDNNNKFTDTSPIQIQNLNEKL